LGSPRAHSHAKLIKRAWSSSFALESLFKVASHAHKELSREQFSLCVKLLQLIKSKCSRARFCSPPHTRALHLQSRAQIGNKGERTQDQWPRSCFSTFITSGQHPINIIFFKISNRTRFLVERLESFFVVFRVSAHFDFSHGLIDRAAVVYICTQAADFKEEHTRFNNRFCR
jgi:hypothetical protein